MGILPTQPGASDGDHQKDAALVLMSLTDAQSRSDLIERLRCVPRILSAKNALLSRPLGRADLEDLAQETVMLVWSKRGEFEGRSSIETWVYPFCYHALMNRLRAKVRSPRTGTELPELEPQQTTEERDFTHVHAAIARLEPDEEQLVRLKHFDDMTFQEIGEKLSVSPNTIKARYYRAIGRLRVFMGSET